MYCIECGQAQPVREARFCPYCGTALHHPPPSPPTSAPQTHPAEHATAPTAALPRPSLPALVPLDHTHRRLQGRLRWALLVAAVLLSVFLATAAWWWFKPADQEATPEGIAVEALPPAEPAASAANSTTPQRP